MQFWKRRRWLIPIISNSGFSVLVYSALFASVIFWRGGFLAFESRSYLVNYTDNRPLLQKVFDVNRNDMGYYQGRELSYFLDFFDANFIKQSIRTGFPHFYSLLYYLSLVIVVNIGLLLSLKQFNHRSPTIYYLTCILLFTSPLYFFGGIFFRSGKYVIAALFCLLLWLILNQKRPLLIFLIALPFTLIDRQGYFYTAGLAFILFVLSLITRKKLLGRYAFVMLTAFLIVSLYSYYLGPWLIYMITGQQYRATDTINLTLRTCWGGPPVFKDTAATPQLTLAKNAAILLADVTSYILGNLGRLPAVTLSLMLIIFTGIAIYQYHKQNRRSFPVSVYLLSVIIVGLLTFIMIYIMLMKHNLIMLEEVKRTGYYTNLFTVSALLYVNFAIGKILTVWPRLKNYLTILLVFFIIMNMRALRNHANVIFVTSNSFNKIYYQSGPYLIQMLQSNNLQVSDPAFSTAYYQQTGVRLEDLAAKLKQ